MQRVVELIRVGYDAYNREDFEAAAALLHPEITWNRFVDVEAPVEGADAARELMEPRMFAQQRNEVHAIEVIGDQVLVDTTFHGVGAASGIELADRAYHLWRIKDGRAIEFTPFRKREDAMRAARQGAG